MAGGFFIDIILKLAASTTVVPKYPVAYEIQIRFMR